MPLELALDGRLGQPVAALIIDLQVLCPNFQVRAGSDSGTARIIIIIIIAASQPRPSGLPTCARNRPQSESLCGPRRASDTAR